MNKNPTEGLKSIFKGVFFIMIGIVIARFLGYVYRIIVARISPEAYGILSLCLAFLSIASVISFLAIGDGAKRFVAFYRGVGRTQKIKGVVLSSLKIGLISSTIATLILFFFSRKLTQIFFHNLDYLLYMRFFAMLLPFYVLKRILVKNIVGFKEIRYRVFIYDFSDNLLKIIFTAILLFLGMRIWAAILGYGLMLIISFFISLFILEFKVFSVFRSKKKASYNYKELFDFSIPLLFIGVLGLFLVWTDTLMLGYFTTTSMVGVYNVAALLASVVYIGSELFGPIYIPVTTELYAQEKKQTLNKIYKSVNKWIFGISFPAFLLITFFGFILLKEIFGKAYTGGAVALTILCAGKLVQAVSFTSIQMLNTIKKTRLYFIVSFISAGINLFLNYLLIPKYGIEGAAMATAISLFVYAILAIWLCYHFLKITFITIDYLKIISAAFVGLGLSWFAKINIATNIWSMILIFLIFSITYILTALFIKTLNEEDKIVLSTVRNKIKSFFDNHW